MKTETLKAPRNWVTLANLVKITSVGCQYCGFLLHSGITSTTQLS
ncbi:DUF4332 domain-containing protein [Hyella patelloides]